MKKIGKIQINPEKVMNNDELLQLRGGYGGGCCFCKSCVNDGYMIALTHSECESACRDLGCGHDWLC